MCIIQSKLSDMPENMMNKQNSRKKEKNDRIIDPDIEVLRPRLENNYDWNSHGNLLKIQRVSPRAGVY